MYDVENFTKPVPMNPERSGEYLQGESQSLEFFRHERNQTFVSELIRKKLSPNALAQADVDCGVSPGAEGSTT